MAPAGRTAGSLLVLAGNVGNAVLNVVLLLALARLLGPEAYGSQSAALAALGLFTILAEGGLNLYAVREGVRHPDARAGLYTNLLRIRVVLAAGAMLAALAFGLLAYGGSEQTLVLVLAPLVLSGSLATLLASANVTAGRFAHVAAFRVLDAALLVAVVVPVALATGDVVATSAAYVAASALNAGVLAVAGRRAVPFAWAWRGPIDWRPLRQSLWFTATILISYFTSRATLAMAALLLDPEALGHYAAALRLVDAPALLITSIMSASFPTYVARLHEGTLTRGSVLRETGLWAAVGAIAGVVMAWLAGPVVPLVLGPGYEGAVPMVRILLWIVPLGLATMPTSLLADATGHQRIHSVNGLYMVAISVGGTIFLTAALGDIGPAVAVLAARLAGAVVGIPLILWVTGALRGGPLTARPA